MKNTNIIHFNITINTDSVFMVFAMFSHWHAKKKIVITTLLKHSCAWLEWPKPVRLTDQDFFVTEKKAPLKCNKKKNDQHDFCTIFQDILKIIWQQKTCHIVYKLYEPPVWYSYVAFGSFWNSPHSMWVHGKQQPNGKKKNNII